MNLTIGFIGIAVLLVLILIRMPIAVAMAMVSFLGVGALIGMKSALGVFTSGPFEFVTSWMLSSIPMFMFMGYVCYQGGLTDSLFLLAKKVLQRISGGLGMAAIAGAAAFSAVCGSSLATAAAMGRIAVPEMVRNRYMPAFAGALVAVGGTLGNLIPPGVLFILYGIYTEVSIGKLFIAGILPGILSAVVFCITIWLRVRAVPSLVDHEPTQAERADLTPSAEEARLVDVLPITALFIAIMGGLFLGLFSAAEAGAVGAFLALLIAWPRKQFTRARFKRSVVESLEMTGSVFLIGIGSIMFTQFIALSGVPDYLAEVVASSTSNPFVFVTGVSVIYFVLGCFIEPIGIMLLTLPFLLPIMKQMDIDMIWMGVLIVKYLELGMITPPVGMNLFVIKAMMPHASLGDMFRQVNWFIVADLVTTAILIAFPPISTWLPKLIG